MELSLDLRTYSSDVEQHEHDFHQLVLPVEGKLEMMVGSQEGVVSPQHVAVIQAGTSHDFLAEGDNRFIVADVPEIIAPQLAKLPAYIAVDNALGKYIQFVATWLNESQSKGFANLSGERQMLLLLLQLLSERQDGKSQIDPRVEKACRYLEQHYSSAVGVDDLAKIAHIGPRQFSELFRRHTGLSVKQYIIEKRMQQAWILLTQTSQSIQQVSQAVGYEDHSAFYNRFKSQFGRTPKQVRLFDQ